jgi:hypothetical protein
MTVSADFEREGYALFRKALDVAEVARLEQEIVQSYWGPLYRHDLRMMRHSDLDPDDDVERSGLMDSHLWELPELGSFSRALRSLLFSDAIYDALHAIDGEARYTLHQSIFFSVRPAWALISTAAPSIPLRRRVPLLFGSPLTPCRR